MVSVYNAGEFIENRLNNLRRSTIANDSEIWVVNADSPDPRDHAIPQKFNVKYVKLPQRIGIYAAWNYIISNSNSLYITNANSDDIIAPDGYEKLALVLDSPSYGFAYPSWYITEHANMTWYDVKRRKFPIDDNGGDPGNYNGSLDNSGVGHFPMWKRELHTHFGLFDEEFKALGDADWWARCYHLGNVGFHWYKERLACYLWRNGQNLWHREVNEAEWHKYHQKVQNYRSA